MKKRWLILPAAVVATAVAKKAASRRESEWHGLTETEARSKLEAKLPGKIPEEKRSQITDKVVAKMLERGIIVEGPDVAGVPVEGDSTIDLRATTGEAADLTQN